MIGRKDKEIATLKEQLELALSKKEKVKGTLTAKVEPDLDKFLKDKTINKHIQEISEIMMGDVEHRLEFVPCRVLQYYIAYNLLTFVGSVYKLTDKGREYYREYLKLKLQNQKQ